MPAPEDRPTESAAYPRRSIRFDCAYATLSFWLIGGIYLDGWAHNHHRVESFVTPWHGILYSGFFALLASLLFAVVRARRVGYTWRRSLPKGYVPSLVGGFIFLGGGVFDLIWHQLFGIEADVEALLSPSHLILGFGAFLLLTGPLRAAWTAELSLAENGNLRPQSAEGTRRRLALSEGPTLRPDEGHISGNPGWRVLGPAVLSLTYAVALLAFFTQFAHPEMILWSDRFNGLGHDSEAQALGVGGILIQAALLTGFLLFTFRRWRLPFGSVTLVAGLSSLGICAMRDTWDLVPAAIAAGIVGDVLVQVVRPSLRRIVALRAFALAFPACFYGFYFLAVQLTRGIGWSIHLWLGSVVVAGIVGLLLSYLMAPPEGAEAPF